MVFSPNPGVAAVMPYCVVDPNLAGGRIKLRRNLVRGGGSPRWSRGPPPPIAGHGVDE